MRYVTLFSSIAHRTSYPNATIHVRGTTLTEFSIQLVTLIYGSIFLQQDIWADVSSASVEWVRLHVVWLVWLSGKMNGQVTYTESAVFLDKYVNWEIVGKWLCPSHAQYSFQFW